jgi:DNA repair photolyase
VSNHETTHLQNNVINFPIRYGGIPEPVKKTSIVPTPLVDEMEAEASKLNALSEYKSNFDWEPFRDLERRALKKPIRGGFVFKSPFKLVNSHATCQQCLYSFEVDTYGRGCAHNCVYCYAKAELTVHGYWNKPYPVPVDINAIRKSFYTVFETDKNSKWREIMEKRIPIRIGSMSDSFMWMDDKLKVTKEFISILNHYQYPHLIFTRSDLIARDDYMKIIDPKLAAIQFSISSTNDKMNKLIEPGAPSARRRLAALTKLSKSGYWTTVRINPLFPIHPDGYFTNPNFKWNGPVPKFEFSSFEMVDEIANAGVPAILAGMGRFSSFALNQLERVTGFDLRQLYTNNIKKSMRDFHFSDQETRYYYDQIKERCDRHGVQFTTCYIGNGELHFWKDQDIWSNKTDCCNVKGRIAAFKNDCRGVSFDTRLKYTNHKKAQPIDNATLHRPLSAPEVFLRSLVPPSSSGKSNNLLKGPVEL